MNRRGFLICAGALLMAPAIVRASSLMSVSAVLQPIVPVEKYFLQFTTDGGANWYNVPENGLITLEDGSMHDVGLRRFISE